jgi:hypothetical protein
LSSEQASGYPTGRARIFLSAKEEPTVARHSSRRSKPKKRINRYNPNHPDYHAVHGDWTNRPIARGNLFSSPFPVLLPLLRRRRAAGLK